MNTSLVESAESIIYLSSDNEPVAETFIHLYAILTTLEVIKQYLEGQQASKFCAISAIRQIVKNC